MTPFNQASIAEVGALSEAFHNAMRQLTWTENIVTSRDVDGEPHGMVASSVIPVSMDPPSMLAVVNRSASLHSVLRRSWRFCVNVLAEDQHFLLTALRLSEGRAQFFRTAEWSDAWEDDANEVPWLRNAPAAIECAVELVTDYSTHALFVGRVVCVRGGASRVA